MVTLQDFAKAWCHPDYPPSPVSALELQKIERELAVAFPEDYRRDVLSCGLPNPTAKLWDWLWEGDLQRGEEAVPVRPAFAEFHSPASIQDALGWIKAGMPNDLIPFASDSAGSQICFSRSELARQGTSAVYFWDHDFLETEKHADSFTEWLQLYVPAK